MKNKNIQAFLPYILQTIKNVKVIKIDCSIKKTKLLCDICKPNDIMKL